MTAITASVFRHHPWVSPAKTNRHSRGSESPDLALTGFEIRSPCLPEAQDKMLLQIMDMEATAELWNRHMHPNLAQQPPAVSMKQDVVLHT